MRQWAVRLHLSAWAIGFFYVCHTQDLEKFKSRLGIEQATTTKLQVCMYNQVTSSNTVTTKYVVEIKDLYRTCFLMHCFISKTCYMARPCISVGLYLFVPQGTTPLSFTTIIKACTHIFVLSIWIPYIVFLLPGQPRHKHGWSVFPPVPTAAGGEGAGGGRDEGRDLGCRAKGSSLQESGPPHSVAEESARGNQVG